MRADAATVTAAILVGIEGVGVAALAGWMTLSLLAGEIAELGTGLALLLMTAVVAVGVLAFAVAILRDHGWARSGAIVVQLLILAVALGVVTGEYANGLVGAAIAAPAIVALIALFIAARAAGKRAAPPADS